MQTTNLPSSTPKRALLAILLPSYSTLTFDVTDLGDSHRPSDYTTVKPADTINVFATHESSAMVRLSNNEAPCLLPRKFIIDCVVKANCVCLKDRHAVCLTCELTMG